MIKDLLKGFTKHRTAMASAFDSLDQVRTEIDVKVQEIQSLRTAPRPVAAALAAFDAWADRAATDAVDRVSLHHLLGPTNDGALRLPVNRLPGEITPDASGATEILLGLLILTGRDTLRAVIEGQLADLAAGRETLDAEQRTERIASAEADLLHLQLVEETIVRQMQNAGLAVVRRVDATALALLADDTALPG